MLQNLEILQVFRDDQSRVGIRAMRLASKIAQDMGARIYTLGQAPEHTNSEFYDCGPSRIDASLSPDEWRRGAADGHLRVVLETQDPKTSDRLEDTSSTVRILLEPWQTEETLFASSGIAHLLGDPERAPLVPAGNFAAHTIGYAAFAALISLALKWNRFRSPESATIYGPGVLTWVNWKSAIQASFGNEICRKGVLAEWPILECKDGHAAFVFNERDWQAIVDMIGDPALAADEFRTFEGRQNNRDGYMKHVRSWFKSHNKAVLAEKMLRHAIPGAPASTVSDLLEDPLLKHRDAFTARGPKTRVPRLPHRVAREEPPLGNTGNGRVSQTTDQLPLSGFRVLDFGIITAGAGVSALLADMGAEVLKIESLNRSDPFRIWPGAKPGTDEKDKDSPVFKSNNRNKYGVAIDLKTEEGKRQFFELAASADIVLENYRRGVLDRLGLSFDALRQVNPHILLASISSQGLEGPGSEHTTFGSTLEASSGFASLTCYDNGVPVISGRNLNYPDQIVCVYGAAAVAAYAVDCRTTGKARHIDVSQRDCAIFQLGDVITHVSSGGSDLTKDIRANSGRPHLSGVFKCADGRYAALSADQADVSARIDGLDSLDGEEVRRWAATKAAQDAVDAFLRAGQGGALCTNGFDILENRSLFDAEVFAYSPNKALVKGFPFQLVGTPMGVFCNAPRVGEHTDTFVGRTRGKTGTV